MGKKEKLIKRLLSVPKDFTYAEAKTLLSLLGYEEKNKGRTSGSRVLFLREADGKKILLHKPHPGNVLKHYSIVDMIASIREGGDIE